jgi:L-alanine-DL-glutamate epimerase-like enolase superfamily enzyme
MTIHRFRTQVLPSTEIDIVAPRFSISSVHNIGVWLVDDSGATGFGYGYVFDANSAAAVQQLLDSFAHAYVGSEPQELRKTRSKLLTKQVNFLGMRGLARLAASVLDMAAWDLLCRTHDTNLLGLIGAERTELPTFSASGLWAEIPPDELAEIAKRRAAELDTPFAKMWVNSKDIELEYDRIVAAREALGPEGGLIVDAAQAYDWRTAAELANRIEDLDILWFEDPIEYEDIDGLRRLADSTSMRLGAGEHVYGLDHLKQHLDTGALQFHVLDLERIGGITDFLAAAALCEAYRVELASHCYPHISTQVLATARTGSWVELAPLWDHLFGEPDVHDGVVRVDTASVGTGVHLPEPPV